MAPGRGQRAHVATPEEVIAANPLAGYPDGYSGGFHTKRENDDRSSSVRLGANAPHASWSSEGCGDCGPDCCPGGVSSSDVATAQAGSTSWSHGSSLDDYLGWRLLELEAAEQIQLAELLTEQLRIEESVQQRRLRCPTGHSFSARAYGPRPGIVGVEHA